MNNGCYRIVFNHALGVLQVVSELATAHSGGRSGARRSLRPHRLAQACALLLATGLVGTAPGALAATATGTAGGNGGPGTYTTPGAGGAGGGAGNAGGQGGIAYSPGSTGSGADGSGGGGGIAYESPISNGGGGGGGGDHGGYGGFGWPFIGGNSGGGISFSGAGGGGGGGSGAGSYTNAGAGTGGGGGGGGGAGLRYSAGGSNANAGTITGGAGGAGGNAGGYFSGAGGGGGGGAGVVIETVAGGSFTNSGVITGGAGGAGGNNSGNTDIWSKPGGGGAGGFGAVMNTPGTLVNTGVITGGAGGARGTTYTGSSDWFNNGQGGIGIAVAGGATIVNSGTISGISGGWGGDPVLHADAILFTGTGNTLELLTGSNIVGNLELWAAGGATIAARNAGLGLSSDILMGSGSTLELDASTAGLDLTGSIIGNGDLTLSGGNVLGLSTIDVASVGQDAINTAVLHGNVTTSGAQAWDGQLELGTDVTLASSGVGAIAVANLDGAHALTIDTSGITTLGNLGQTAALTSLTTDAGGSTVLNGDITTTGDQAFNDAVALGNDLALHSTAGNLGFTSTLTGTQALSLTAAGDVSLSGAVTLGSLSSTSSTFSSGTMLDAGTLSVTTTGGAITQSGPFNVGGVASFNAGINAITLTNAGNDFVGIVNLVGGATQIVDSNALLLGTLATGDLTATANGRLGLGDGTVAGNLSAVSTAGDIVERGALTVSGTSTLDAGSGAIILANAGNDFVGSVAITSGDSVAVVDSNDLAVSSLTSGTDADVSLTAGGTLVLSPFAIDTGTGALTLASNGGSFATTGDLSGGAVRLTGRDGLVLNNDVTGTTVALDSTNATIIQGAGALTAATLTGGSGTGNVTLDSAGNAIAALGDFTAGDFSLVDSQLLAITGDLAASGDITLSDAFGIDVTGSVTAGGSTTITSGTAVNIGTGGTVGSIAGDVVDDGLLAFNHSDNVTFADAISGAGALQQVGSGTLALDGDSSAFAGTTLVGSGTLLVGSSAGNGAALGGDVQVDSGATLGGHGTIGGNVNVDGGAHLAPGNSIGTLTIGGDLSVAQGAQLDYEFGAPGSDFATAGAGDSVVVGGNLTLNGAVLNVTDAGGMGPGLYRIFSWGGTLTETNGGVSLGTTPGTDPLQIQTLVADKQINLLDTAGLTLNFWNGNGQATASSMGGGDGTWSTTSMNWTDANATTTAAMQPQPGFAIFGGAPGTVTIDNGNGAVSATGLQFASDGYTLQGDTLTLVGNGTDAPVIRVGDGSSNGAGYTATIDNVLAGSDGIAKTDAGTLVLTAANTFSGGLAIEGGTVSVSSDANLGDAANSVTLDGGMLQVTGTSFQSTARDLVLGSNGGGFDIADAANVFTVDQALDGSGAFLKDGAGTLVLDGTNTFTGGTTIGAGTLQLGDGGITGSIVGNVVDSGTLAFDRSDAVTFAGTISGTGGVVQQGAGTTILTADNSFTGGTTVAAGTLQLGGGGTSGSIVGDVVDNGTLAFDRSDAVTFAGTISGTGGLQQQGAGTTILTADNSFSAGTVITDGTLQLGNGGTTGSIVGNVVDNGTLAFDRGDAVTFAGTISGTGGLQQRGAGTTILTAGNSFSGGTVISGGTLQLGDGGTSGMITGNVLDNGTLAFDRSDDVLFAGAISGSGALLQQGGGTLVLDGNSGAFAGSTDVQSGTLVVGSVAGNGASLGGDVTIDSGATLAGLGAIGGDVVNDGMLSPGMGVGTLTIHGDYTQTADGSLAIDANPDGQADLMVVDGDANLDGSALILAADGNWNPLTDYTILTAGGNVSGTFGSATSSLLFLDPVLNYDAHAVRLSLQRNAVGFASVGATDNQRATATAADTLGFGNTVYDALTTLDATTAPPAFDALSGEVHASVQTALVEDSRYLRLAMRGRLDSARADGSGVWVSGWGHWARDDSDGNAAALRTDGTGLVAGLDTVVGADSRIGVVVGVGHAHARVDDRASRADVDSRHFGIYGGTALGGLQLQAGAARSSHDIDSRREVAFAGFADSLRGKQDANTTQFYVDASHDFTVANGTLSPFLDLAHVRVRGAGFTESGGDAALRVDPTRTARSFATVGARGDFAFGGAWRLRGRLGWSHTFGGDASPQVRESFAAGSDTFVISGVPIADNALTVEAGLGYQATPVFRIDAHYLGRFASDARDQGAGLTLAWSF